MTQINEVLTVLNQIATALNRVAGQGTDESGQTTGGFPIVGRLTPQGWAEVLHVSPETIRRWVVQYDVRHKQFGAEMVIDAEDLWDAVPYQKPSNAPRKQRGGARKKKAS